MYPEVTEITGKKLYDLGGSSPIGDAIGDLSLRRSSGELPATEGLLPPGYTYEKFIPPETAIDVPYYLFRWGSSIR